MTGAEDVMTGTGVGGSAVVVGAAALTALIETAMGAVVAVGGEVEIP